MIGAGALFGARSRLVRLTRRRFQRPGLGSQRTLAFSQVLGTSSKSGLEVRTDLTQLVSPRLEIGVLGVDGALELVASCSAFEDFLKHERALEQSPVRLRFGQLPLPGLGQLPGPLAPAPCRLDHRRGMPNSGLPAFRRGRLSGGFVPGRLLGERVRPTRRVPAVPRQSGSNTRGVTVPTGGLFPRAPFRVGGLDEWGEPLRKFTQRIATPLKLR